MVPEGWDYQTLGSLASVKRGRFSPRPRNDPRYYDGYMPFVQTGDVTQAGKYLTGATQSLNAEGVAVSKVFPPNSILITIAANIGHTAITTFDVACPDSVVGIQPMPDRCDVRWLKDVLHTRRNDLEALATQNAQKNINLEILTPFELLTPPLPEQRRIAGVLDAWDTAIATAERLVAAKQLQKRNVTDHLMTQSNDCVLLGSLGHFEKGRGLAKTVLTNTGISCLRYAEIYTRYGDTTYSLISRTSEAGARASKALQRGDIVFAASGETAEEIGKAIAYLGSERAVVGGDTVVLTGHGQDAGFLARLLNSPKLVRQKAALGKGHSVVHIHAPDLAQLMVPLPSLADQQRIAAAFEAIENEISGLEAVSDRLRHQKRGLMQQLLTGKLRVPESIDRLMPKGGGVHG